MSQLSIFDEIDAATAEREAQSKADDLVEREARMAEARQPRRCGDCGEWVSSLWAFNLNHGVIDGSNGECVTHVLHFQHARWAGHPKHDDWSTRGVAWLKEHGFSLPKAQELMVNLEAVTSNGTAESV